MFQRNMYSVDDDSSMMKIVIVIIIIVVMYYLYTMYVGESAVANPYGGTFYGRTPLPIFGVATIPAANYF
jgi:hypothetical protein